MPTTPRGYEYPSPTGPADGPYAIQRALESVDADVTASLGSWVAYTPTLTATSANPVLGVGSLVNCRYVRIGKTVMGNLTIIFGSSGMSAGLGTYILSLPVARSAATNSNAVIGHVFLHDVSTGGIAIRDLRIDGSMSRGANFVQNAVPWVWAAGDQITATFAYESV